MNKKCEHREIIWHESSMPEAMYYLDYPGFICKYCKVEMLVEINKDNTSESLQLINKLVDALIWCSGSGDFAPEGTARAGWLGLAQPAIDKGKEYLEPFGSIPTIIEDNPLKVKDEHGNLKKNFRS